MMRNADLNSGGRKIRVRSAGRRFVTRMGLVAALLLSACGGSAADESVDVAQGTGDTENSMDGEQDTSESTSELPAWTTFTTADGLASNDVVAVDVHADGTTWVMTLTEGDETDRPLRGVSVSRFDNGSWTTFEPPERFTTGPITLGNVDLADGLAAGPNGTAWYLGGGLWEFDGESWTTVHDCDEMLCPEVPGWALDIGGDGVLWSATTGSLLRRDGDEWTTVSLPPGANRMAPGTGFDSPEFGYGVDPDGVVWVLTIDGVASFDGEWRDHPVADGALYGNEGMYGLAAWTLGATGAWTTLSLDVSDFAVTGGPIVTSVSTFDGDDWSYTDGIFELGSDPASLTSGPDLKIATVQDVHQLVSTSLFSGGERTSLLGLIWTDHQAGTRTVLTVDDGLPSDNIRALVGSPDGVVWIATDAGLARFIPEAAME